MSAIHLDRQAKCGNQVVVRAYSERAILVVGVFVHSHLVVALLFR